MQADARLLLTQWTSASFPTGAFAWSHGLEQAIAEGAVRDAASLTDWLRDLLHHGTGRNDAILIALAFHAEDPAPVAALADALSPSVERRKEALGTGGALARTLRDAWDLPVPDMPYPVALGHAAQLAGLPVADVIAQHLQAFLTNLVQCALRLMPLGQTGGQRVLRALLDDIPSLAEALAHATEDDLGSAAFAIDTASMRHETLEPRLFRS
ncbi:urease accessory protein UreF [Pelagovum pacificum]|uniref:Urease accessory protein UreF n=1 Tax=Pelagovum pacificum TaxID=2588711 RepID=A0A5C5G9R1_9RHOB|nr:urease accessory UreF family protein [Pelagovum pacificum]QQA42239.1 urease accessory protein UreF [Pelagovum pacificum]TNY31323.1 urease accessory protein UreF [Pelagovum pacificum]